MDGLFTSGNRADDLLDWANKITGLGGLLAGIGYHASQTGDTTIVAYGEVIGNIIEDYGTAIKKVAEKAYWPINDCFSGCNTIHFAELKREYNKALSQKFPSKELLIDAMNSVVDKADAAIAEIKPIISLKKEMLKKIEGIQPVESEISRGLFDN